MDLNLTNVIPAALVLKDTETPAMISVPRKLMIIIEFVPLAIQVVLNVRMEQIKNANHVFKETYFQELSVAQHAKTVHTLNSQMLVKNILLPKLILFSLSTLS